MDYNDKNFVTGQYHPGFGEFGGNTGSPCSSETGLSKKERIHQWFLEPLMAMDEHQAFICLMACFPLWEKFLRATGEIGEGAKFSEGQPVFKFLGTKWGTSQQIAYQIWQNFRNGLLHQAMVKTDSDYDFFLTAGKEQRGIVTVEGKSVIINPWSFRDQIVTLIGDNKQIWDDREFSFMKVYRKL